MRPKPSTSLLFIQRHRVLLSWTAIYMIFVLVSTHHMALQAAFQVSASTIAPMIILSQTLREYLIPRWLHRNVAVYYLLSFLLVAILTVTALQIDLKLYSFLISQQLYEVPNVIKTEMNGVKDPGHVLLHLKYTFLLLTTMAIVTISRLLDERQGLERQMHERQLQNEIRLIRAQINPHFLFNALNCIYSLTVIQDENAPDSVLKLSEMLRYVVDDCQTEKVTLQKEVQYIRNYIDFQQIRMEHRADITFDVQISNPSASIPPMLFQPIVENCFKHSNIAHQDKAFVHISLVQDKTGNLRFETANSICNNVKADNERQGIGLQNVRQHLELIFGSHARLIDEERDGIFHTCLVISAHS